MYNIRMFAYICMSYFVRTHFLSRFQSMQYWLESGTHAEHKEYRVMCQPMVWYVVDYLLSPVIDY